MSETKATQPVVVEQTATGLPQQSEESTGLNLQRYLRVLYKRKWLILGVIVVIFGGVAVWTFSQTRIYRSTATVLVDREAPNVLGEKVHEVVETGMGNYWRAKEYMETQIKVITSKSLARAVVEKLGLDHNRAFYAPPGVEPGTTLKHPTPDQAAVAVQSSISAASMKEATILEISAVHSDPEIAALLANGAAQTYLDQSLEYKLSSTAGAAKWLADQLDDLKKQLENAEMALHDFKKKNNIVSVSLEDKQTLISSRIEKINNALTDINLKRMALAAERREVLAAKKSDPLEISVAPVMDSTTVQALKQIYIDENRKYSALREKYGEKWPEVREQKARLDVAKKDLDREIGNELAAVEGKFREVKDNEAELKAALQDSKDEALDLNKREVEYQRLKRTQENTAKLYAMVLSRMKESDLSAQLRVSNVRILDRAVEDPVPIKPRVQMNLSVALVLGLLLGIGLAFLVEMLDNTVKSHEEVEQLPTLVFLGLLPKIPGAVVSRNGKRPDPRPELDLVVHRSPKSAIAESCRAIRTNLLFTATDRPLKTLVVSSPGPKEGKTTTAVSLAIAMAQSGNRTLIVDTDLRRPRLHRIFGVPGAEGITSVLLGDGALEQSIKTTEVPSLFVLPCGPVPPNPAELCQSERFKSLLAELAARFDRIILDSPPVIVVTDAVILSTLVDGVLLVARTGQTTKPNLRETVRQLQDVGGQVLGCVLNDMDIEKGGYGYYRYRRYGYYRYGYYRYGYGHQYGEKEEDATS